MLGIGFFELLLIAIVGFIAIGPNKLPQVMRNLAGLYRKFLDLKEEVRFQLFSADERNEIKNADDDCKKGEQENL